MTLTKDDILAAVEKQTMYEAGQFGKAEADKSPLFSLIDLETAVDNSQAGDAVLLSYLLKNKFLFDHTEGRWYKWAGSHWQKDYINSIYSTGYHQLVDQFAAGLEQLREKANQYRQSNDSDLAHRYDGKIKKFSKHLSRQNTINYREKVIRLASCDDQTGLGYHGQGWDADPLLFATQNAVIDLRTGLTQPGTPQIRIRICSPVQWIGLHKPAPAWEDFLLSVFGDDDLILFVQRLLGYAITGDVSEHVLAIFYGPQGRNGKSVLLRLLHFVLRDLFIKIPTAVLLANYRNVSSSAHSADLMLLHGVRLAIASESPKTGYLDNERVKELTGGDPITARAPYARDHITFIPQHKIFFMLNDLPRVTVNDPALWQRLLLIRLKYSFVDDPQKGFERQRDPRMFEKLQVEAPGILAWLVRGCLEWQRQGLNPPKSILAETEHYRRDEDILQLFLDHCTQKGGRIQLSKLYRAYSMWAKESGYRSVNLKNFNAVMSEKLHRIDDGHGRVFFHEIDLTSEWSVKIED